MHLTNKVGRSVLLRILKKMGALFHFDMVWICFLFGKNEKYKVYTVYTDFTQIHAADMGEGP